MKRFFKWTGLAAFAALLPLLMAPSGGFPFFPTFGRVVAITDGQQYILRQTTAGADQKNWILRTGGSPAGTFALSTALDASPTIAQSNAITCTRSGTSVTGCTVNGQAIPRYAYGAITPGNGTCSIASAATVQNQNLASCTCGATGGCTVTFTTSYTTNPPACSVTGAPVTNSVTTVEVTSALPTSVSLQTLNGATNTTQNGGINVICVGT